MQPVNFPIHQIFFEFPQTKKPWTEQVDRISKRWKEMTTSYYLWTLPMAQELVRTHYPMFYRFFEHKTEYPIIQCDLFRYILLYHYGGLYVDLDFYPIQPFGDFLKRVQEKEVTYQIKTNEVDIPGIILTEEWFRSYDMSQSLHNGWMLSLVTGHPFWLKMLTDAYTELFIKRGGKIATQNDVFEVTGTRKLRTCVEESKRFFRDVFVLPYYYHCPFLAKEDGEVVVCNGIRDPDVTKGTSWSFFPESSIDKNDVKTLFPSSYTINVFLQGSFWK